MSFQAKYPGRCVSCGERIHEGEWVRYEDDDSLVHDNCDEAPDVDAPQRNERKCPDCFTIHAGECA
ncbi:hypothetical protein [Mycolicibacterium llatzerense]|uniref:hypothetical protein n=1 Tax=Mycolicibacterium llatzerense TaxID=280871 RepID=UPI0021B617FB|nr:hypothetical protein [Mycolicibacterium llatzerense]MCT7373207.1 hypothetical protein [Mycolicibacterium llatzerense]